MQKNQLEILKTQKVLNEYIEFKNDVEKFTKHVEEKNANRKNKRDNQKKS